MRDFSSVFAYTGRRLLYVIPVLTDAALCRNSTQRRIARKLEIQVLSSVTINPETPSVPLK